MVSEFRGALWLSTVNCPARYLVATTVDSAAPTPASPCTKAATVLLRCRLWVHYEDNSS